MDMKENMKRLPTGVFGLDELIEGGFPEGSVNLVTGPAGGGKTLLALQFLVQGAMAEGEKGLYITIEEKKDSLCKAMMRYGIDLADLEEKGHIHILDVTTLRGESTHDEELDIGLLKFDVLKDTLEHHLEWSDVKRVCIDSLTAAGLMYEKKEELRSELFRFIHFLRKSGVTSLLLTESLESGELTRFGVEQFLTDSFIVLGLERIQGELRRTITVRKMRFTKQDASIHPFLIMDSGIVVAADEKVV